MDVPAVAALDGAIRHYAWGSPTAIPALLGQEPDGRPVAELWFGAHLDDPSRVPAHATTLDRLVAADPLAALGPAGLAEFGPRLPFLVKLLAADKALSIQVHPNRAQARAGFAAEQAENRPAEQRNYRDDNHKPELIYALTRFDALCGFRAPAQTRRLLAALGVAELERCAALLAGPDGLRAAFTELLTLAPDRVAPLVAAVERAAAALPAEWAAAARAVRLAAHDFPGDIGVALTLLLNPVRLEPGEAIFLAAGNVHCYLRGFGLEILANSDNVLRCGLTPKRIDVPELLKITDFPPLAEPRWPATGTGAAAEFDVPVPDFRLTCVDLDAGPYTVADPGPHLVVSTGAGVRVRAGGTEVEVASAHGAFVSAAAGGCTIAGQGRAFVAGVRSGE